MSCYFIADIKIKNEAEYQKYLDEADEIFSSFSGKYIALDDSPKLLEGTENPGRIVVIEFPDEKNFNDWYYSEEYQRILKFRLNAADCRTILINGK